MADNTETNPGTGGDIFGSDDITGVKYPRIKLIHGADGTNDGDVSSANPLPVTANLSATDNAVLDQIELNQDSQTAILTTIDTDTGDIATNTTDLPNVIGTDGAAGPTKAVSVGGTQSTGELEELRVDSDGHLQVDVLTAPSTTVTATNLDIRDLTNTDVVTAELSATDNAVLDAIAASASVLDDWDNGASDGASVSGDVAHDTADAGEPVKIGAKAYSPDGTTPGTAVAEADRTDLKADLDGRQYVNITHPRRGHKHLDGSSAYTDESIVADPGDGFQVVITNIICSTGAATAMNFFLEEGSTKIFGPIYLEATAGRGFGSGPIHLPVTASTAVTLTSSAAIAQSFDIDYFIQAV